MKILIIEDDYALSNVIKRCIESSYSVDQAFDGEEGKYYASQNIYDVIILDLMLPVIDGYTLLESLRREKIYTPVLILTAKGTLEDKIKGFKNGADDYLVKPFEKYELLLRIEAIIRRTTGRYDVKEISFKEMKLNMKIRSITIGGEELNLQGKQYDILEYLMNHKEELVSKNKIFDKIWGFETDTSSNVVEVYASGIRKILKQYEYDKYFKTIRGAGYILTDNMEKE